MDWFVHHGGIFTHSPVKRKTLQLFVLIYSITSAPSTLQWTEHLTALWNMHFKQNILFAFQIQSGPVCLHTASSSEPASSCPPPVPQIRPVQAYPTPPRSGWASATWCSPSCRCSGTSLRCWRSGRWRRGSPRWRRPRTRLYLRRRKHTNTHHTERLELGKTRTALADLLYVCFVVCKPLIRINELNILSLSVTL